MSIDLIGYRCSNGQDQARLRGNSGYLGQSLHSRRVIHLGTTFSLGLLHILPYGVLLVELTGKRFLRTISESLLEQATGFAALRTQEALGFHTGFTLGADGDLDGLQTAPPIWTVNLIEPSGKVCSYTV